MGFCQREQESRWQWGWLEICEWQVFQFWGDLQSFLWSFQGTASAWNYLSVQWTNTDEHESVVRVSTEGLTISCSTGLVLMEPSLCPCVKLQIIGIVHPKIKTYAIPNLLDFLSSKNTLNIFWNMSLLFFFFFFFRPCNESQCSSKYFGSQCSEIMFWFYWFWSFYDIVTAYNCTRKLVNALYFCINLNALKWSDQIFI